MTRRTFIFKNIIFVYLFCFSSSLFSQSDWAIYLEKKDKGLMSIHLDLYLNIAKPAYRNLLIVGTNFKNDCYKNGFPKENGLDKLSRFSDSVATTIHRSTKYRLAGILTYQCYGFDVYYVKDTTDLRSNLDHMIKKNYGGSAGNYFLMQYDKKWTYYFNIFPTLWPNDFLINQEYLIGLVSQGDNLSQERTVRHWINFKKEKRRLKYAEKIKKFGFTVDSISYKKGAAYPLELQVSRKDFVDPENINQLTKSLKASALSYYGIYDGWSTELIVE